MINTFQQLASYLVVMFSLFTACGVLLHDTGVDKAITSIYKAQAADAATEAATIRSGSNLHPHAEHMSVKKDGGRNPDMMPRKRISKKLVQQQARRMACGYHADGVCMPLAGEWT